MMLTLVSILNMYINMLKRQSAERIVSRCLRIGLSRAVRRALRSLPPPPPLNSIAIIAIAITNYHYYYFYTY